MRFIVTLFLLFIIHPFLFAQDQAAELPDSLKRRPSGLAPLHIITCPVGLSHTAARYGVLNRQFLHTTPYTVLNPFAGADIADWAPSHGSPQINIFGPLPAGLFPDGTSYASMWAFGGNGEGIVGNLSCNTPGDCPWPILQGKTYVLSFYRQSLAERTIPANRLDELNIVLINCNDLINFDGSRSTTVPERPLHSQVIYCETNITPGPVERVTVEFTANGNYQLVWIYPRQSRTNGQAWVNITFPEITHKEAVVATLQKEATPPPQPSIKVNGLSVQELIRVQIVSPVFTQTAQIDIFDRQGRLRLSTRNVNVHPGSSTVHLKTSGLETGMYYYRVLMNNQVYSDKFLLSHLSGSGQ